MNNKIKCPKCAYQFDVEEVLKSKLEIEFQSKYEKKVSNDAEELSRIKDAIAKEKDQIKLQKEKQLELVQEQLKKLMITEKKKLQKLANEEVNVKVQSLLEENDKRKEENRKLKLQEIEFLQKQKDFKEKEDDLEIFIKKKMFEQEELIKQKATQKAQEVFEMQKREYEKQLADQIKLTEEMARKQNQGSMQLQGEVQELALEELLSGKYPWDNIEEVGKGVKGADCIQTVFDKFQNECGRIVYESKRTKNFSADWIEKLKQDQIIAKADIAVLVTEVLPSDMKKFGEKDGVWICTLNDVSSLSFVLREILLRVQKAKNAEDNKGEKMELLYKYLTGNEFAQNIQRIVENYDSMILQLNTEKKRVYKSWGEREKQIWVVQENLSTLFGSIKGIAGRSIDSIDILELPDPEIEK
tara:strand:+ start:2848 stop:4086 length:1239 start_codon:yes stop_codon:yes gene_type:complete